MCISISYYGEQIKYQYFLRQNSTSLKLHLANKLGRQLVCVISKPFSSVSSFHTYTFMYLSQGRGEQATVKSSSELTIAVQNVDFHEFCTCPQHVGCSQSQSAILAETPLFVPNGKEFPTFRSLIRGFSLYGKP